LRGVVAGTSHVEVRLIMVLLRLPSCISFVFELIESTLPWLSAYSNLEQHLNRSITGITAHHDWPFVVVSTVWVAVRLCFVGDLPAAIALCAVVRLPSSISFVLDNEQLVFDAEASVDRKVPSGVWISNKYNSSSCLCAHCHAIFTQWIWPLLYVHMA